MSVSACEDTTEEVLTLNDHLKAAGIGQIQGQSWFGIGGHTTVIPGVSIDCVIDGQSPRDTDSTRESIHGGGVADIDTSRLISC